MPNVCADIDDEDGTTLYRIRIEEEKKLKFERLKSVQGFFYFSQKIEFYDRHGSIGHPGQKRNTLQVVKISPETTFSQEEPKDSTIR